MKKVFAFSEAKGEDVSQKFIKYLKRYAFSEFFKKYEEAVKNQEIKNYFKNIHNEQDIYKD